MKNHLERAAQYLEYCRKLIGRLANIYALDADDLAQDMFLFIVNLLDRDMSSVKNEQAYVYVCVRKQIMRDIYLDIKRCPERPLSLDMEMDMKGSLFEMLAAPSTTEAPETETRNYEALYRALATLPIRQQQRLTAFFQLTDFEPQENERRASCRTARDTDAARWSARNKAYNELRRNEVLQAVYCQ